MEKLELKFNYEKETKNAIRYQEELGNKAYGGEDIAVGTLYVQKKVLGSPAPQRLKVIIEPEGSKLL
jgi:hypothetical protein